MHAQHWQFALGPEAVQGKGEQHPLALFALGSEALHELSLSMPEPMLSLAKSV